MESGPSKRKEIIDTLNGKSEEKLKSFNHTLEAFQSLKNALHELSGEINEEINNNRVIKVEYRDKGQYEAQLQFASDILIFNMHTNVFQFNRDHAVWNLDYVKLNKFNTLCGVINVYNFLADSFKKNRTTDEGYLVARIYINHDGYFFVEGKRMQKYNVSTFGSRKLDDEVMVDIVEILMLYAMNFDLLVPPFDTVKVIEVEQMNTKVENSKISTGKRLGYTYNTDDI
ncbi:MAG: hypothetical protein RR550_02065 [Rikenellaceae bacterium]